MVPLFVYTLRANFCTFSSLLMSLMSSDILASCLGVGKLFPFLVHNATLKFSKYLQRNVPIILNT